MVFENVRKQHITDPSYANEHWRAKHHYKEGHVHDPPYRRNRDFKPVNFGTFKGIPNYKHAEPWAQFKNLRDIVHEEHHHPIKWIKTFLFGAITGGIIGYSWFILKPVQAFPIRKLL